jgi:hypothetical protein
MSDPQRGYLHRVTYEDGTTETMHGWNLRMVADAASDPHHEPVKVELVQEEDEHE